ncbi:MAG: hypothetical protein AAFZ14_12180, partial [Pseudomonadota bacterium]
MASIKALHPYSPPAQKQPQAARARRVVSGCIRRACHGKTVKMAFRLSRAITGRKQLVLTNMLSQYEPCAAPATTPPIMPFDDGIAVCGGAVTPFNRRRDTSNFRDWAFAAYQDALAMAEVEPGAIEALFVASESDFLTAQLNPATVLASDLGLTGAALMRCEGGGASGQLAVHAAVQMLRAGHVQTVAVVGVDPSASALPGEVTRALYGLSFDGWTDGATGLTATALYALSYQAFCADQPLTEGHLGEVTRQNRSNALANPKAHLGRVHSLEEIAESPMIA